jgi:hypothetical protein
MPRAASTGFPDRHPLEHRAARADRQRQRCDRHTFRPEQTAGCADGAHGGETVASRHRQQRGRTPLRADPVHHPCAQGW